MMTTVRDVLRRFDRWTVRTFNPMPLPFGLGPAIPGTDGELSGPATR